MTRTRVEVREHFDLEHWQLRNLLKKYELTEHLLTPQRLYAGIEKYLIDNPGTTYSDLAEHLGVDYRKAYRAVESRGLEHLIELEDRQEVYEKIKETMLERYGVENAMQHQEFIDRAKETNLERYGHEYAIASEEVRDKIRETMLERYGVENAMQNPQTYSKYMETIEEKYGVTNVMKLPEMVTKLQATNIRRYGAKHKPPTIGQVEKRQDTMIKRYGKTHLMKTPEAIQNARETLLSNDYREKRGWPLINEDNVYIILDTESFKNYMETLDEKPTVLEFIETLELPIRTVYNFIQTHELQDYFESRWGRSYPEDEIYNYLLELGIEEQDIIRGDRELIKPYEIDLYLPKYKMGIEFNGTYYHSTIFQSDNNRHQTKALMSLEQGVQLYQVFEFDWNNIDKREIIKSQIRNLLGKNTTKIYARECEIREVSNEETKEYMETNHIQGDGNLNKQINYGLYHNNKLVYMMTFGKWRRGYKGIIDYEIFRSASILNTTVVGGASKLFKHFLKSYPGVTIGTYSNLQTGDGNLYKMLGFEYSHTTKPTSFRVDRQGNVYTMFSKTYQESRELQQDDFYYEIYNTGSKLWIYRGKEKE